MIEDTTVKVGEGLSVTVPADQAAAVRDDLATLSNLFEREVDLQTHILSTFPSNTCRTIAIQKLAEMSFWLGESLMRGTDDR